MVKYTSIELGARPALQGTMAWEILEIVALLTQKNQELYEERNLAVQETQRLRTESAVYALVHRIMHDLKAPLASVIIMLNTDLETLPAANKDRIRQVVGRLRAMIDLRLKKYTEDAIAKAKEPETKTPSPEVATVGGALQFIFEEEEAKARARGVTIVCDVPKPALRAFAALSFSDLCRIFSNLLTNAIDASEAGAKRVYLTAKVQNRICEIVIRDSGLGFSKEVLTKVMASEEMTTKPGGTGLGLQTVRALVAQAKGDLDIQKLTNGTTIRIHLPLVDTPLWFFDITRTHAQTVIALDDDLTMGEKLKSAFPNHSVQVFDTEEAFLTGLRTAIDPLVLVDYDYGGDRNGIDLIVAEKLSQNAILLSGRLTFDPKLQDEAQERGVRIFPKQCLG
ncbi:HAMP domain-containing sensor histidine kinase [Bdellovibrionota bacterium FG-2]